MANIDDTILQIGKTTSFNKGSTTVSETYIGKESEISVLGYANRVGKRYNGGLVTQSQMEKIEADRAKWSVVYQLSVSSGGGGGGDPTEPLDAVWSENCVQYQYPLEKYLSPVEAGKLKEWEDLEDATKKASELSSPTFLSGMALNIAKLKFAGTTDVIRCWPQATRVTTYAEYVDTLSDNLNKVDDTPKEQFDWWNIEWMKVQFDWEQNYDGSWRLTESWIGANKQDGGWNRGLYRDWHFYQLSSLSS